MSRNQRKLLFVLAASSTLIIALQSLAIANQKSDVERRKIMADEQPKTQKAVVKPKGGSTGPTAPPTLGGGSHK